jgi:hypothetical protein
MYILFSWAETVHLVLRPLFGLLYEPQIRDDDNGTIDGMRSTRRKPVPVPICPPHVPHDLTRARTRAAAVASR